MSRIVQLGVWVCVAINAVISAIFINRTSFDLNGQRTYTLFDDAMISMRYARNLAEGNGLVWNEGEHLEGYTNFLWTLYMAALHILPVPDRLMSLLVATTGAVLLALGVWLAAKLAELIAPEAKWAPLIAAALTATSYPMIYWTLRGMEVGLISVFTTGACVLALRFRDSGSRKSLFGVAALLSAAVLTRPDAVVIAAVVAVGLIYIAGADERRRVAKVVIGIPLAVFVAHTAFRIGYYGDVVPNTYTLKVSHVPLDVRIERGGRAMIALLFKQGAFVLVAAGLAAVVAFWKDTRVRNAILIPALLVAALFAYSVYVGGDAWENLKFANRYTSTVLPLLFVLAAIGIDSVVRTRKVLPAAVLGSGLVLTPLVAQYDFATLDALYQPQNSVGRWFTYGLVVAGLALVVGFIVARKLPELARGGLITVATLGVVAVTTGPALSAWWQWMAPLEPGDRDTARYGVALKQMTEPQTRIALSSAGNIAYFAGDDRVFIDELGKMDRTIANEEPRRADFPPGHQKWNYDYTFFELQPDLISQSFGLQAEQAARLVREGWTPVNDDAFVRPGATNVDADAIREFHEDVKRGWAGG